MPEEWQDWMDWSRASETGSPGDDESEPRTSLEYPLQLPSPQTSINSDAAFPSTKKRKASNDDTPSEEPRLTRQSEDRLSAQNKSHSIVEKRYRTNLNQKINDLGDCIPKLRGDKGPVETQRDTSTHLKHNKAIVLTEAVTYIRLLEQRNRYLEQANLALQVQVRRIPPQASREDHEHEATQGHHSISIATKPSDPLKPTDSSTTKGQEKNPTDSKATTDGDASQSRKGIIKVPDEWRRMWKGELKPHAASNASRSSSPSADGSAPLKIRGGKQVGRLMLGSLAGIMILDEYTARSEDSQKDRGLSSLPLLRHIPRALPHFPPLTLPSRWDVFDVHLQSRFCSSFVQGFFVFSLLGLLLFAYLFNSRPPTQRKGTSTPVPQPAPSILSPLEVRQRAFLTAIQTIWFPRHHAVPEMLALNVETAAYIIRQLLGWKTYSWLTGRSEEEEIARVRAWDIAIDAQLSGGDPEISKSRLVLSLWASGTLPSSPARFMLKALHIRILFWQPSTWPWLSQQLHRIALILSRWQWSEACKLQKSLDAVKGVTGGPPSHEPLTDHLRTLMKLPHEDVMNDNIILKLHNLTWNSALSSKLSVDDLCEDNAMRGPLDALASCCSGELLNTVVRGYTLDKEASCGDENIQQLQIAQRCAPLGSLSSIRAIAARAIFDSSLRHSLLVEMLSELSSKSKLASEGEHQKAAALRFLVTDTSNAEFHDLGVCAFGAVILQDSEQFEHYRLSTQDFVGLTGECTGVLGWTAIMYTLRHIRSKAPKHVDDSLVENVTSKLATSTKLSEKTRASLKMDITALSEGRSKKPLKGRRRCSEASNDTGYASMTDDEEMDDIKDL